MPLIEIPPDARKGKLPCGECHIDPGMTCDVCGAYEPTCAESAHDFKGWRKFADGNGGETVCTKCGMGAMTWSLRTGL